ncbi:5'/3'-nucleotidase SurE [Limnochorda pilosa]|uniref:5'-nucleotidase SurE n=1 Tax=Limnochorda pilosa TaxID=1555112 RepID=A0A0K2SKG0_LIMPI|nr:5'/3'-nucleotidase SurE [Limnochorda pilosa]BAS27596.1 stationary phase survival protein SurE [Limnochorda pilosa]
MRILVTNDDGVHAPGLRALAGELARVGEVVVVAPDRERSGAAHAITVHTPLRVSRVEWGEGIVAYAVDGTPTDCVKLGMEALVDGGCGDRGCQAVVSGINRGPNLGTDVIYSGTVSGALEGHLQGVPAIAASLDSFTAREESYRPAARVVRELLGELLSGRWERPPLLNVNVPGLPPEAIRGVRITRLGVRRYRNVFHRREDPRGRVYYWLAGEAVDLDERPDTDARSVREGYVSVTPLRFDLTDAARMARLRGWEARTWEGIATAPMAPPEPGAGAPTETSGAPPGPGALGPDPE